MQRRQPGIVRGDVILCSSSTRSVCSFLLGVLRAADAILAELAGPEVALGPTVWANFFTHCRDAQMVLERWPYNEPFPGAKGWSVNDVSSHGINLIFMYMMSKSETKELAPRIVAWSDGQFSFFPCEPHLKQQG